MEHRSIEQLLDTAAVTAEPPPALTRDARLTRWAELLEREPTRRFLMLHRLESSLRSERPGLREDTSPIAAAFADPFLREIGLTGDTYGHARDFFGLSERQAHRLLCSCLNGPAVEGRRVAANLRNMTERRQGSWASCVQALRACFSLLRPLRQTA